MTQFNEARLNKVATEMGKHQYTGRVAGTFGWGVKVKCYGLLFSKPDDELEVEIHDLTALGALDPREGVSLGYREAFYKAGVVVTLPGARTWPNSITVEGSLTAPTAFKVLRKDVRNEATVNLGQAVSRDKVLGHLPSHLARYVETLLHDLDKCLAGMFWEGDKPVVSSRGSAMSAF
jgi:hypothetical protein